MLLLLGIFESKCKSDIHCGKTLYCVIDLCRCLPGYLNDMNNICHKSINNILYIIYYAKNKHINYIYII